jgi:hypothetical protein
MSPDSNGHQSDDTPDEFTPPLSIHVPGIKIRLRRPFWEDFSPKDHILWNEIRHIQEEDSLDPMYLKEITVATDRPGSRSFSTTSAPFNH